MDSLTLSALAAGIDKEENVVFSPISLQMVLGMLYHAADEHMRVWISNLGVDTSKEHIQTLLSISSIEFFNAVWLQQGYEATESLMQILLETFNAELSNVDFGSAPEAIAYHINSEVARATEGMIGDVISPNQVAQALAVFLNTVLLKATWKTEFNSNYSFRDTFFGTQNQEVDFMFLADRMQYYSDSNVQSVLLPRSDGGSVQVILPKDGLSNFIKAGNLNFKHHVAKVELTMPKVSVQSGTDCSELLGISTISLPEVGLTGLCPIAIQQSAKLLLDEKGVTAAAATIAVVTRSLSIERTETMEVDIPFLLVVREANETISFVAAVFDPTK